MPPGNTKPGDKVYLYLFLETPALGAGGGQDCHWLAEWTIVVGFFLLQRQRENSFLGTKQGWGDCSRWVTPTVIDFVPCSVSEGGSLHPAALSGRTA